MYNTDCTVIRFFFKDMSVQSNFKEKWISETLLEYSIHTACFSVYLEYMEINIGQLNLAIMSSCAMFFTSSVKLFYMMKYRL